MWNNAQIGAVHVSGVASKGQGAGSSLQVLDQKGVLQPDAQDGTVRGEAAVIQQHQTPPHVLVELHANLTVINGIYTSVVQCVSTPNALLLIILIFHL